MTTTATSKPSRMPLTRSATASTPAIPEQAARGSSRRPRRRGRVPTTPRRGTPVTRRSPTTDGQPVRLRRPPSARQIRGTPTSHRPAPRCFAAAGIDESPWLRGSRAVAAEPLTGVATTATARPGSATESRTPDDRAHREHHDGGIGPSGPATPAHPRRRLVRAQSGLQQRFHTA